MGLTASRQDRQGVGDPAELGLLALAAPVELVVHLSVPEEQHPSSVAGRLYRVGDHSVSSNKLKAMRWQWNILRNEMDLPVYKAVYYFIHYAIRAFAKAMR